MSALDDILRMIKDLRASSNQKDDHGTVVKSVPMTKDQIKDWKQVQSLTDEVEKLFGKVNATRDLFWSKLELDLDEYRHMHIDQEKHEIVIYDNRQQKGSIKSPIQIKRD